MVVKEVFFDRPIGVDDRIDFCQVYTCKPNLRLVFDDEGNLVDVSLLKGEGDAKRD